MKDKRKLTWEALEADIQLWANYKDPNFKLNGPWKKYIRKQGKFKIFAVDRAWVRSNLSVTFGHGGHGLVHEFIPFDEIWIDTFYWISLRDKFESCVIHEITEYKEMTKGTKYWKAHQIAHKKEKKFKSGQIISKTKKSSIHILK